ncbi:MAG: PrsW family glutamic-type intramembrane protease [Candidatus Nomurabacteria bacterium]|nr:PrsW family glutamic-type intramembrane protease [Candidatus Nomurabacteria bacterium]
MINNPKTFGIAILAGILPALVWLWFWLREDEKKTEPRGVLFMCFVIGMISVVFVLPIEQFIQSHVSNSTYQIISWAGAEEIIKYIAVLLIIGRTSLIKEPKDWAIYLITGALGFAALENVLFLVKPLSLDHATVNLLTTQLRFLGSTLLHAVSSGLIGISLGLCFYMNYFAKKIYFIFGILMAITLHSAFNFFIMDSSNNFLKVFGFLWVVTIINILLIEKLRRMSDEYKFRLKKIN